MKLTELKGIKTAREKLLNSIDIFTDNDLLNYFPAKYFDLSLQNNIFDKESPKLLYGEIVSSYSKKRGYKKGIIKVQAKCLGRDINIVWFNQPYIIDKLISGKSYVFFGKCSFEGGITLINPIFEAADNIKKLKDIMPVYSLCDGLSQSVFIAAVKDLLSKTDIKTAIPVNLIKKYNIADLNNAYHMLHCPKNLNDLQPASDRAALEILYYRFISHYILSKNSYQKRSIFYKLSRNIINPFINSLKFELTGSQKSCIDDILNDLNSKSIMNRMVQGDVGSGKTVTAFAAMFYVVKCGGQCAFMAPTEILARQHYNNALKYFNGFDIYIEFLSGSLNNEQRKTALFNIKNNVCSIIIGTHSLFSQDVEFNNLKLVICDEQHRFGVKQRNDLKNKGSEADMLIMSATPLPRTLNLALYGELAVSTLTEKPLNRTVIKTNIVPEEKIPEMYDFILKFVKEGRQVYIVSKSIEMDSTENDSAKKLYKQLSASVFKGLKTGLLHGNMTPKEKECVMSDFSEGKINVLISTSIIEVGIDVKNAAVIVIYEADKFGLAQLHQLRGRVGRGEYQSYCFLLCGNLSNDAYERLNALKNTDNGFELAEKDLDLRGAGDFLGLKQHGTPMQNIKNLNFSNDILLKALKIYKEALQDTDYISSLNYNIEENELKDVILN